jgi:dipeptidase E
MNALDGFDDDRRRSDTTTQVEGLAAIGLLAENLDLRDFSPDEIEAAFGHPDFVWVRGGNVFTLRMAMARSGLDEVIKRGLAADAFVYGGFSAGACVLAPSLVGLEHCDPIEDCRAVYGDVRFDGLAVLDRPVVPHLDSPGHPEAELVTEVAARYAAEGQGYWGLRDGQALVVDGADARIRG